MKKSNLILILLALLIAIQSILLMAYSRQNNDKYSDIPIFEKKINKPVDTDNKTKFDKEISKPAADSEIDFKNLRTTFIPGVYCQQVDDFGGYRRQRHFFYNASKGEMVEIKEVYFVDKLKDLGEYREEFEKYGVKGNQFTHKGKPYIIPKIL